MKFENLKIETMEISFENSFSRKKNGNLEIFLKISKF